MKRRLTHSPYSTVLILILILTFSFIYVPLATSQDSEEIISKLMELQEDVSTLPLDEAFENPNSAKGQRKALTNKIKAVINQIEAGASKGAINKLENDLKNTIEEWITEDYQVSLIEKIDEIISLIKGEIPPPTEDTTPPNITSVSRIPETPNYDENVTVIAQVEDEESGVDLVILSYSINTVDWTNVTMNLENSLYVAEIPSQPYNTNVSYKVHAYDKAGNSVVSDIYSYVVIDSYPPMISWVERSPISPNYNDTVSVTASVSEPADASGVRLVILSYFDGVICTNVTMTLVEKTIYEGSVPVQDFDTTVEYMVYASDNATNWVVSSTYSYIVGDEYSPTVRIDKPTQGSYVKGIVEIVIFVYDDNFEMAELSINGAIVKNWTSTGEHTYNWNTTIDGVYTLNLTAYDEAGKTVQKAITVIVDLTLPSASINTPVEGSYLKGLAIINVTGADENLKEMQLYVGATLVQTFDASGTYTYYWNTSDYFDGVHTITLKVYDKADNTATIEITVNIDNTLSTAEIRQPLKNAYIKGTFSVVVYGNDTNFRQMTLYIGNNLTEIWDTGGEHTYIWDTSELSDGSYTVKLLVSDKAGNSAETQLDVIVDNTSPTASINAPSEGVLLKDEVIINVTGGDVNLEKMLFSIGGIDVLTLEASGTYTYVWNTSADVDGSYTIKLEVNDKAGNAFAVEVSVAVDNTLPVAEIRQPLDDALVKGTIIYVVYGNDTNFDKMMVYIGDRLSRIWTESGEYDGFWNSLKSSDGVYQIKLEVFDKAGNRVEKIISATVDNTLPTAVINTPAESTFLRGTISIDVTGDDANFEEMELRINGKQVESWTEAGSQIYPWNTKAYSDGSYTITLTVYDKAVNNEEISITTVVDNTAPLIEAPSWEPKEPSVDTPVNIAVKVSDIQPGSGIQSVTLWYKNTTMDDWQSISMSLDAASGNWTATIPAQPMETAIEFYIEALDNAGNKAETAEDYEYNVIAPTGIPLAWIIVIILLILAATIAAVYFWRKRRREKQGINDRGGKNYKLTILLCF